MTVRSSRAQALLELALCAPIVILLALGTAAALQLAGARAGLDAATQAAANAAARSSYPPAALEAAQKRFAAVAAAYPLRSPELTISVGGFDRAGHITATASARVDIGWAAFVLLPSSVTLRSQVMVQLEPWRSHVPVS